LSSSSTCSRPERLGGRLSGGRPRALIAAAGVAALAAIAVVLGLSLSQGESHTPAELKVQRSQLAFVGRQLFALQQPLRREVTAAATVWPSLAAGLPASASGGLAAQVSAVDGAAQALPAPAFLGARHELIGPAQRVANLFYSFELLSQRGWAHVDQAVVAMRDRPPAVAHFERINASLYIDSVYDGNFDVALIGERVLSSYERLGGAHAFGSALTPVEVQSIAAAYAPSDRLTPHLWQSLLSSR
jgi:hypothetical protein